MLCRCLGDLDYWDAANISHLHPHLGDCGKTKVMKVFASAGYSEEEGMPSLSIKCDKNCPN